MSRAVAISLLLAFTFIFCAGIMQPVFANEVVPADEVVPIGQVGEGANSEQLKAKIDSMAGELYNLATNLIAPITVIILIGAGFLMVFFKEAKRMIIYAILGLVIVFWAPFIVQLVVNWVKL